MERISDVNGPNCAVAMGYIRQLHKSVFSYPYKGLLKKKKKKEISFFKDLGPDAGTTSNTNISLKIMEV